MSKGRHLILDLYGCSPDILDDYGELECLLETALNMAGATMFTPAFVHSDIWDSCVCPRTELRFHELFDLQLQNGKEPSQAPPPFYLK